MTPMLALLRHLRADDTPTGRSIIESAAAIDMPVCELHALVRQMDDAGLVYLDVHYGEIIATDKGWDLAEAIDTMEFTQ